jgi:hypothetical protein
MKQISSILILLSLILTFSPNTILAFTEAEESYYSQGDRTAFAGLSLQHLGIHLAFDYAVHDLLSVGASTGFNRESDLLWKFNYFPLLARVALHPLNIGFFSNMFTFGNNVDIYVGGNVGWLFGWGSLEKGSVTIEDKSEVNRLTYGLLLGMHMNTSDKWGFYVEHCGEASRIVLGATYKL